MIASTYHGLGRHEFYVKPEELEQAMHYLYGVMVLGLWAATLARVSVAYMLLGLNNSLAWRITLWAGITIQIANVVGANICLFLQCSPLRAMWAVVPDAKCWSSVQAQTYGYVFAGKRQEATL